MTKFELINKLIREMRDIYTKEEICDILLILELELDNFSDVLEYCNDNTVIDIVRNDYGVFPVIMHFSNISRFYYQLVIDYKDDFLGYCMCDDDMEGYNKKHECCGLWCDWSYPTLTIEKIEYLANNKSFEGLQKDLWKEEDEFIEKYFGKDSLYELEKEKEKERTERQLQYYKSMIEQLEESLKNL